MREVSASRSIYSACAAVSPELSISTDNTLTRLAQAVIIQRVPSADLLYVRTQRSSVPCGRDIKGFGDGARFSGQRGSRCECILTGLPKFVILASLLLSLRLNRLFRQLRR